jgi:hypothetical protein
VDRSPPWILEREKNSGLQVSGDVVGLYKNFKGYNFQTRARFRKDYSRWEVVSGRTASSKSKFELVQYVLHKLMKK